MTGGGPRIVADRDIPWVEAAFAGLGRLRLVEGRRLDRAALGDAEVLLVRSVTRVDEALLAGGRLRWLGSATAGVDHVDRAAVARRGIVFAHAPGVNARAVAEYVLAALLQLAGGDPRALRGRRLAVIGYGHTGRRTAALAAALGLEVRVCDPPLAAAGGADRPLEPLPAVLDGADAVSLHVSLVRSGPHPSENLVDAAFLERLRPGAWLINTSRGAVVDEAALAAALAAGRLTAALDVWRGEPAIDPGLLARVRLATPHIAGYSCEGRWGATWHLHRALCAWLGRTPYWSPPWPETPLLDLRGLGETEALAVAVARACPLEPFDRALREAAARSALAETFDALRRDHPPRREFAAWRCRAEGGAAALLAAAGFRLVGARSSAVGVRR